MLHINVKYYYTDGLTMTKRYNHWQAHEIGADLWRAKYSEKNLIKKYELSFCMDVNGDYSYSYLAHNGKGLNYYTVTENVFNLI